jgi:hypothetical protein
MWVFASSSSSSQEVKQFVDSLHASGQHFVVIDDCGIPNVTSTRLVCEESVYGRRC